MHDYQHKGYTEYGARMGRGSDLRLDTEDMCMIRQVPIDSQGYDPGGAYWGTPSNLYCVESLDSGEIHYLRSGSIDLAKAEFPNASWEDCLTDNDLADFLNAYVEAALFSSCDESGEFLDCNYSLDDLGQGVFSKFKRDCAKFLTANAADIGSRITDAGHDFWFTRQHDGVGFWETPDWPKEAGERLTKAAHAFGECYLYVGDDNKIYCD
jgi:hypothetical protein